MAKLEAVLDADITPFQRKLAEAAEKAKQFGEGTADVGKDLFKSLTGFDIGKALGIGGAIYAASKLGDALIDAAKEGLTAFTAYQDAVLKFKYTIPVTVGGGAAAGGRAAEAVESATAKAGLFSAETMRSAALYLMEGSREFRESPEKLNDMLDTVKALALKTGTSPEAIAESYRRLIVSIKEEGGSAVGKFFKATPGLETETEKLRDAHAEAYLHTQGLSDASEANKYQAAEYHRLQNESVSDFMAGETERKGVPAVLEEIKAILERSAPKAIIAEAEEAHPEKMLAKAWEEASAAFGKELKPAVDDFVRMLLSAVPAIQTDLVSFGASLNILIEGTLPILSVFGNIIQSLLAPLAAFKDQLDEMTGYVVRDAEAVSKHVDEVIEQKKREKEAAEAPEKAARAALAGETGIYSKERIRSEEEIAKINARTDASHEESQRRIAASQSGMGAIEEETANRIARLNEEATIRDIERQAAQAKDDSEEKTATLNRLAAEDRAAQVERDDIMAEAREKERVADKKNAQEIADLQIKSAAEHAASQRRVNLEAAQADLQAAAHAAARRAVIDRPRGTTEALDKQYAIEAEAAANIINIKAAGQEKINAAEAEAANRIATIDEAAAKRNVEREKLATHADSEEKSAALAKLNAEDVAGQLAINDAMAEAREKEREADIDVANKIIDAQEEASEKMIDAEKSAALEALDKMKGPYAIEEAPGGLESVPAFGKWRRGPGGYSYYEESAYERKQREERNAAAEEANRQWKELMRMGIEHEFAERKRAIEDDLERARPTLIGLKRVHEIQQEEDAKAILAEKGRTEADTEFVEQHARLQLPVAPDKKPGAADISRKVLAELLIKILDVEYAQLKDFDAVFLSD